MLSVRAEQNQTGFSAHLQIRFYGTMQLSHGWNTD